jgi:hypothetical protein
MAEANHDGRSFVMCTVSELNVVGFVRFIAELAGITIYSPASTRSVDGQTTTSSV